MYISFFLSKTVSKVLPLLFFGSIKMTITKPRNCIKRDIKSKHQTNRSPEFWNQLVRGPLKKIETLQNLQELA